jgi:hypothetical protein
LLRLHIPMLCNFTQQYTCTVPGVKPMCLSMFTFFLFCSQPEVGYTLAETCSCLCVIHKSLCPDRIYYSSDRKWSVWRLHSFWINGYSGTGGGCRPFPQGRECDHSPTCSSKIKNTWRYSPLTYTPSLRAHTLLFKHVTLISMLYHTSKLIIYSRTCSVDLKLWTFSPLKASGYLPGHRHGKLFIGRPCKERADDLLKLRSRHQLKMVVATLTGHAAVRGHLYTMGLSDGDPTCRFCRKETETVRRIIGCCETLARHAITSLGTRL